MARWGAKLFLPLVLLLATAAAAYFGFRADHRADQARADAESVRAIAAIQSLTDGLSHRLQDVAGLFEASSDVSKKEFDIFTQPVVRTSEASGIAWAPVVAGKDRREFERANNLKIHRVTVTGKRVPSPRQDRYVVPTYAVLKDNRGTTLGGDLNSTVERRRALVAAASVSAPVATPPIRFASGRQGFSLYMPVYGFRSGTSLDGPLGYAVGAFRFDDLAATLRQRLPDTAGLELSYRGNSLVQMGPRDGDGRVAARQVDIAGQTWDVRSWTPSNGIGLGPIFLIAGLLLTALVTLLTTQILRASHRGRQLAEARTREQELLLAMRARESAAAEARFQQVFDSATVGMALMDTDGRYTKANHAFCDLVGRDESELIGLTASAVTHPDDLSTAIENIRKLARGDTDTFDIDKRYVRPCGEIIWAVLRTTALKGANGEVERLLVQALDISERRVLEDNLKHMADHDPLTALANRRSFHQSLLQQLAAGRRYGPEGALMVIDLDNFKGINDVHGHNEGDQVLQRVAEVILGQLRESDIAGRLGGDEFGILLPKGTVGEVEVVAERLVRAIAEMGARHSHEDVSDLTCSIGAAILRPGVRSVEQITDEADIAMYEAKAAGGNRYSISSGGAAPTAA